MRLTDTRLHRTFKTLLGNGRRLSVLCMCIAVFPTIFSPCIRAQQAVWRPARNCVELNSPADDFAPAIGLGIRVYFSSERTGRSLFYSALLLPDVAFGRPESVGEPLDPPRGGSSYLTFLPKGGALLSAFRVGNGRSYLNIAATDTAVGSWRTPTFIPELASDNFTAHPAVSPDGTMLVFSSDRDGGLGGADLWFSYRLPSGAWGVPVHAGEMVNSPGHEITPYFAANDTLYFASDGFGGAGGFEIFMTTLNAGAWSPPVPLGEINSEYDESDFVQINGSTALFVSNRPGGAGELDLYLATRGDMQAGTRPTAAPVEAALAVQTQTVTVRTNSRNAAIPVMTFALFPKNTADFVPKTSADSAAVRSLQIIAQRLTDIPSATLVLTGWTDKSTPRETIEVAGKRAESIRNFLMEKGIAPDRIIVRAAEHPAGERGGELLYRVDFTSSTPAVFGRVALPFADNAEFEPTTLECIADARPRGMVASWVCRAVADTLAVGRTIPQRFSVKTARAARAATDTVLLEFGITDTLGRVSVSIVALPVIRMVVSTTNTSAPAADAAVVAIDPLRVLESVEPILSSRPPDEIRVVLYASSAPRAPDAADAAYDIARRRYGASRVKLKRLDGFAELLPSGMRQFAPFIMLIGTEPAGEN